MVVDLKSWSSWVGSRTHLKQLRKRKYLAGAKSIQRTEMDVESWWSANSVDMDVLFTTYCMGYLRNLLRDNDLHNLIQPYP